MSALKRKLIIIICLAVIAGGTFVLSNPELFLKYKTDTNFEYIEEDGSLTLTKYLGDKKNLIIPAEIDSKPVRSIKGAFFNNITVCNVKISEGIESVDYMSFYGCTSILKIELPSSLKTIGHAAFLGCLSLEEVVMKPGVIEIMPYAFSDCPSLEKITLPGTLEFIGDSAFSKCVSLKTLTIPASVKVIGGVTVADDSGEPVNLAGTLNESAFEGCSRLELSVDEGNPWYCVKNEKIVIKES